MPRELIYKGAPLEPMVRYRAKRGDYGDSDPEEIVARRLEDYRKPEVSRIEDRLPGGRVLEVVRAPTYDGGKVVLGNDITELLQAQSALLEAKELAEAANQSKSAFSGKHEPRNPHAHECH